MSTRRSFIPAWLLATALLALGCSAGAGDLDKDGSKKAAAVTTEKSLAGKFGSTAVPIVGTLPAEPANAALRLENVSFPEGTQKVRVFMKAAGLVADSVDSSGYVGVVSPGIGKPTSQSFQLRLEDNQIRALTSHSGSAADKDRAVVFLQALDRSGRSLSGVKVQQATVVDGTQLR